MRYIVVFLVLANLGYLSWHLYAPTQPIPDSAVAPRPLLQQGLQLLNEFNEQSAQMAQAQVVASRPCYLVGDFNSIDDANSFLSQISAIGYRAELHLSGETLTPNYRVYLPPASNREIATITLDGLSERLSGENLQVETYLITRGLLENAIALGVFSEIDGARRVRDQVTELGYLVEIEEIPRSTGALQLVLAKSDFSSLDIAEWLEFAGDRPDLTYSENLCETIAQGAQFP